MSFRVPKAVYKVKQIVLLLDLFGAAVVSDNILEHISSFRVIRLIEILGSKLFLIVLNI